MNLGKPSLRMLLVALCAAISGFPCAIVLAYDEAQAKQDEKLPLLSQMPLPSVEELMKGDQLDWVVLKDGSVIVCEPLYPRPDTLQKMAKEQADLAAQKGGSREAQKARLERLAQLQYLEITLPNDRTEDYRLPLTQVEDVLSFERLMLKRVDQLIGDNDIRKAYELLMEVERMAPDWEASGSAFERLLLKEAEIKIQDGNDYAALALLDELAARNVKSPQLSEVFGSVVDKAISADMSEQNSPEVRYFIFRLARHFPQHPVAVKWTGQLQRQSGALLSQADGLSRAGKHAEAAVVARRADTIWPVTGNQRAQFSQYIQRYQTLRVPVREFPRADVISPVPLEADERHQELTTVPLFEPSTADELTYFQSSYFDKWDPQDLGREVQFTLRSTRPYWQTQPVLNANQIAESLSNQLNPKLSGFNPRLASFISQFSVRSPTALQIKFHRVPLSLEGLFRFPVLGSSESSETDSSESPQVLSTRFAFVEESKDRRIYRRTIPEPDGLIGPQYHIAEVVEQRYSDRAAEIKAFNRGEVDILPHLAPWEIDIIKGSGKGFVQQYAIPQNHVIVFNPKSEAVRGAQLRRSLSVSIDRENLLKQVVLRDPEMKYGRVAMAPWHAQSYATNPLVEKPVHDIYLAFILRLAALEQLRIPEKQRFVAEGKQQALAAKQTWDEETFRRDHTAEITAAAAHIKLPALRMICDPDDVALAAAEKIAARWKLLGYEVELLPANTAGTKVGDADWDLMYRRVRMQEPLLDLWSLLLTDDKFDVDRLSGYPDWMRQELINLDYATSFIDAQERLFAIHRHMIAQAFLIPLWELDDFMAFQRNVSGFEARPLSVYHGIERWMVKP